jgi:hypothetical protein
MISGLWPISGQKLGPGRFIEPDRADHPLIIASAPDVSRS